ncbi:MAG: GDSL-type esterase/lipase family protein [Rikenellaceae bacterium]|nr:GDSL-type esterase/lipase family protein [Rikenellaceae bacterium]
MYIKKFIFLVSAILLCGLISAQNDPAWDDTAKSSWPKEFVEVNIPSSADGKIQRAYMYGSVSATPKPLIVSLHTWSGDYRQNDPLTDEILARDWNYIHPDFRGANNKPEATGSNLVISDIQDAILYALEHTNSNPEEVHIIGVSGGGFATLAAYMNIEYPVKSFSAWAPISDIEAWYWESEGRKQKYAIDILKSTSTEDTLNSAEARRRSPLFQNYPAIKRTDAKLYIYTGVHDGYTGSVPITHSINMYNRIKGELKYGTADKELVSENKIINLVTKRINPEYGNNTQLYGYDVHMSRKCEEVELIIFEGGHEQIPQALGLIPYEESSTLNYNILTIGDSNGLSRDGWTAQLKKMMPESTFVNISQSGRTIGFDNNGNPNLNALKNIDSFIDQADKKIDGKKFDYIVLCLGTNDTKKEFAEMQDEVIKNFNSLLSCIRNNKLIKKSKPILIYVTPSPIREQDIDDKYTGGSKRIADLIPEFQAIAGKHNFIFIDVYHPLLGIIDYYAPDGVHMAGSEQQIIAAKILNIIIENKVN